MTPLTLAALTLTAALLTLRRHAPRHAHHHHLNVAAAAASRPPGPRRIGRPVMVTVTGRLPGRPIILIIERRHKS